MPIVNGGMIPYFGAMGSVIDERICSSEAWAYDCSMALAARLLPDLGNLSVERFRKLAIRAVTRDRGAEQPSWNQALCWHLGRDPELGVSPLQAMLDATAPQMGSVGQFRPAGQSYTPGQSSSRSTGPGGTGDHAWWYEFVSYALSDGYRLESSSLTIRAAVWYALSPEEDVGVGVRIGILDGMRRLYGTSAAMYDGFRRLMGLERWLDFVILALEGNADLPVATDLRDPWDTNTAKAPRPAMEMGHPWGQLLSLLDEWDTDVWWNRMSRWVSTSGRAYLLTGIPAPPARAPSCVRALWLATVVQRNETLRRSAAAALSSDFADDAKKVVKVDDGRVRKAVKTRGWMDADMFGWLSQSPDAAVRTAVVLGFGA